MIASQPRRRDSTFLIGTHKPIIDKHVGTKICHQFAVCILIRIVGYRKFRPVCIEHYCESRNVSIGC